jgi:dihydrofolate synthase/folylpolyglutamate synthase
MNVFAHPNPEKIKLGLSTVSQIDAELGYPSRDFASIHIAGTNGKGSVSTKIAHALMYEGYKVGLYTSPHLLSFCERIWIGGQFISEESMYLYKEQVERAANRLGVLSYLL